MEPTFTKHTEIPARKQQSYYYGLHSHTHSACAHPTKRNAKNDYVPICQIKNHERWKGLRVQWLCDNQPAVHAVCKRLCRDQDLIHLIRCLFFLEAWFGFELVAMHLPGRDNMLADDLSRNRLSAFLSKAPSADPLHG